MNATSSNDAALTARSSASIGANDLSGDFDADSMMVLQSEMYRHQGLDADSRSSSDLVHADSVGSSTKGDKPMASGGKPAAGQPPLPAAASHPPQQAKGHSRCSSFVAASVTDSEASMCPICMERDVAVRFTGCSHVVCLQCAHYLCCKVASLPACPFCRTTISAVNMLPPSAPTLEATK